ncbi:MAG: M23 family metallopeptidase [Pseudomonadota bacterium]
MGNQNGTPRKPIRARVLIIVLAVALAPLLIVAAKRLEGGKPELRLDAFSTAIGAERAISGVAVDSISGIRRIWVGLVKDGREKLVFERDFPGSVFWRAGDVRQLPFEVTIRPGDLGFGDGEALLRVAVWDYSWRNWGKGNHTYLEKTVLIDTRPPEITVLSRVHNVAQGGSGVVRYRLSENCPVSGVSVADRFYPGKAAPNGDHLAYFAVGHDQPTSVVLAVEATDAAGNAARAGFPNHIRRTRFKNDTINLSKRFLSWKMPDFYSRQAIDGGSDLLAQFLEVNRDLRKENYAQIVATTVNSLADKRWQGAFLRMPAAATQATFGDRRTYRYDGREVDQQTHLGIDLASLAHSPVPAANAGRIIFTDSIGIYGKTVIVDHGYGLFSLYSHMSEISVEKGQDVEKGTVLGRTGTTGLAGGDHLHFSMLVHQTFVNPLEWWDENWIASNIADKLAPAAN